MSPQKQICFVGQICKIYRLWSSDPPEPILEVPELWTLFTKDLHLWVVWKAKILKATCQWWNLQVVPISEVICNLVDAKVSTAKFGWHLYHLTITHHLKPALTKPEAGWCIFNIDWVVACTHRAAINHSIVLFPFAKNKNIKQRKKKEQYRTLFVLKYEILNHKVDHLLIPVY